MKTIVTLDRANQPYGFPQLNGNGNFDNIVVESGLTATTISATTYLNFPGSVNPTPGYLPYNNSGLFADTNIFFDGTNIGINTVSPSVKLDIYGNDTIKNTAQFGTIGIQSYATNNAWFGDNVYFNGTQFIRRNNGYTGLFYYQGNEGQFRFGDNDSAGTPVINGYSTYGTITLKTNLDGTFAVGDMGFSSGDFTGATFIVNSLGNTGIGTISPSNRLHVSASTDPVKFEGLQSSTDNKVLTIDNTGVVHTYPISGLTGSSSTSGAYLPLSGGTVTGSTIFQSGITANTISQVNYIDFKTSPTVPNPTGGTLYFDSGENALSYKPVTNQNDVTVNLGQETLTRIYNNLGYQINNGQVLHITGATSGVPTVALANASKIGTAFTESLAQSSGVATHDIPNGQYGFMTNFGIVRDLNTTAFTVGQEVFLSDTVDGGLTNDPNNIAFTSRVSTVGYCIESNATTGKILVNITNENPLQSLTQQEVNVLLGNTISTGVYFYTGMTSASTTTVNVSPMRGWIVYNTYGYSTNPLVLNVYYSGGTNIPVSGLTTSFDTYFLVNSGGTLYQQTTFPTPEERRDNIFLGRVVHPNKTSILNVEQSVDYDVSPMSAIRDLWVPLKLINEGVLPSYYSAGTTSIKTSSGKFWGNGIGWDTNEKNPNAITVPAYSPADFYYTTRTGGTFTSTTNLIDSANYDVGGVITNIPGNGNYSTQRIFMSQSGIIRIQYAQEYHPTLAKAIAAIQSEAYVINPDNALDCILIGLLTVKDGVTDLSNIDDAVFTIVSKFGEILGGSAGIATTSLQQAYNNSVPPEITTNSTLGALSIKNGAGSDSTSNIFEGLNSGGTITSYIRADGAIYGNILTAATIVSTYIDNYYLRDNTSTVAIDTSNRQLKGSNGSTTKFDWENMTFNTLTNNGFLKVSGGTGNIYVDTTSYLNSTGGTVNGLTATTISATTYYGVNAATGGTYSNGTITLSGTGTLSQITGLGGIGGGGQVYFLNLSNTQTPYQEFSPVATTAAQQSTGTSINIGITSTLASFLTPSSYPNTNLLPAGIWSFYLHTYKSNSGDIFNIYTEVYKRTSGGTETLLFTTDPATVDGVNPTPKMVLSDVYYSGITLDNSDRILVVVKGTNNGTSASTLTLVTEGTQYYSYATTTFGASTPNYTTGGTYNDSTGILTFTRTDGNTYTAGTFNYVTAVTESANVITVTSNGGNPSTYTLDAVTGGTYSNGTITLSGTGSVNGTTITGFSTSTATAFTGGTVTGATNFTNGVTANTLTVSATTDPVKFVGLQSTLTDTSILSVDGAGVVHTISNFNGIYWNNATTATTATANNGYIGTATTLTTITLPSTAPIGTIVEVVGTGTGLWRISQTGSQVIKFGITGTTAGSSGYLSATSQYDCVKLLCTNDNTTFVVTSAIGNIFYI